MEETQGIEINENSIIDVQVKRLHEYKRQQMNALYAIYKYLDIKAGNKPKRPITMIFGKSSACLCYSKGYYSSDFMFTGAD